MLRDIAAIPGGLHDNKTSLCSRCRCEARHGGGVAAIEKACERNAWGKLIEQVANTAIGDEPSIGEVVRADGFVVTCKLTISGGAAGIVQQGAMAGVLEDERVACPRVADERGE